ncbi:MULTISPECIES: TrbC/VirB2 family protein [Nocardiopsis]|uniref:TrbC/VirB2 family protein n=1 Tax=Nocardiopsis TaxID=2013 RepID=UPI000989554A|nr:MULTISPECIES: TrbC/VirB2 family protein [Nocardiopsis]
MPFANTTENQGEKESTGGYPDWSQIGPEAPPGLETYAADWIGWAFWISAVIAVIALIGAGIMMMIGRFTGRGAVSADGLRQGVWVCAGACVVATATSIITGILS